MKGIFHPDKHYDWEYSGLSPQEIRRLDPVEDRYYLEYLVLHEKGPRRERLIKKLGMSELPEKMENMEDPSDELYWEYFVLREQVAREPDAEILKEAVYEAGGQMARFAFCYLTKYCYLSPECDAYSYRTYECGWKEGMNTEDVIAFCREMIEVQGPFVREAMECLADPPKDHNDFYGRRMVSHERTVSEPPYVRRERLAPFRKSAEYEQARAEVLHLETLGTEAMANGDTEKAAMLFYEMSYKSERLGKYTQRWEAIDDYARCCLAMAKLGGIADKAEEAAVILKRLIQKCPEEPAYKEQLKKAEEVYRRAVKDTAVETGFLDEDSPIVFYHSFDPEYAEVICSLIEKRFREKGGRRAIEFRQQNEESKNDLEIGNICCCTLPAMIALHHTGNISAVSPFIRTDTLLPALLEQGRINGELCGLPVLVFRKETDDPAYYVFVNNFNYGLKGLDCLDLQILMTDRDFLYEVCTACNAGSESPHVFPADAAVFAGLFEN